MKAGKRLGMLVFAGVIGISGNANPVAQTTRRPAGKPLDQSIDTSLEKPMERFFRNECATCHGLDGLSKSGTLRLPGRILADPAWLPKQEDAALERSILKGRAAMPSFQSKLEPKEVHDLLGLIRSFIKARKGGR